VARDAREALCWSAWEGGGIALADARSQADGPHGPATARCLREARRWAEEGLRVARACAFGILHIDLLLLRAAVALDEGEGGAAEGDARTALETGFVPPGESGQGRLLAASDAACGYAWGEGLARHLLAGSLLLQAAQQFGRTRFSPGHLPGAVRERLQGAEEQLVLCRAVRTRINDPTLVDTERLLGNLAAGMLIL
jgi:hypothetical protein